MYWLFRIYDTYSLHPTSPRIDRLFLHVHSFSTHYPIAFNYLTILFPATGLQRADRQRGGRLVRVCGLRGLLRRLHQRVPPDPRRQLDAALQGARDPGDRGHDAEQCARRSLWDQAVELGWTAYGSGRVGCCNNPILCISWFNRASLIGTPFRF